jgi:hypothetical protein
MLIEPFSLPKEAKGKRLQPFAAMSRQDIPEFLKRSVVLVVTL